MPENELTELEALRIENFALKHNAIQRELQSNLEARMAFIRSLLSTRPGYQWEEGKGLVKVSGVALVADSNSDAN